MLMSDDIERARLPVEWHNWRGLRRAVHLRETRSRAQLYRALGRAAGFEPRQVGADPRLSKQEIATALVQLLDAQDVGRATVEARVFGADTPGAESRERQDRDSPAAGDESGQ